MIYNVKALIKGNDDRLNIIDGVWHTQYKGNKKTSSASILKGLKYRVFASGFNIEVKEVLECIKAD